MKTLYFECRSGISGDMCVASLLDLGVPYELVERELLKLATTGYVTEISDVQKNGIRAVKFDVRLYEHVHSHNCARDILNMIEKSLLNSNVKRIATDIFTCIARAEAKIHGVDAADVHFHEVGAVDSIVDIVATAICIDYLAPERIVFSEITEGTGFVNCEHGVIPVPAPATLALLQEAGARVNFSDNNGEMVTPTGAGIACTLGFEFGVPCPRGRVTATGYGAGSRDFAHPNILRTMMVCDDDTAIDRITVLEAQVDDMTGEALGNAMDRLFECGCLDVSFTPIYMKKNRPGTLIRALCVPPITKEVTDAFLRHTTTLGVRVHEEMRVILPREIAEVTTKYGVVKVKITHSGDIKSAHAEYDDVCAAARAHNVTFADVTNETLLQLERIASCNLDNENI